MNKSEKLLNGISLITHTLPHLHSVCISVTFRAGSLYENEQNSGISHMVEHMFFRRLSDLSQDELYFEMQKIGDEINGETCTDYVSFNITVVPRYFTKALDLMLRYFDKFNWTEKELSQEKEVVFRQIETSGGSYGKWVNSYYFEDTKYSVPIMGTKESVAALSLDEINCWKNEYFTPQNACVVVTGNITDDDYSLLKSRLNNIESYGEAKEKIFELPKNFENRNPDNNLVVEQTDDELADVVMLIDINDRFDYETLYLLTSILGEGCGSKLSMALREKCSFTDEISAYLYYYLGFYRLYFSYTVRNEAMLESIDTLLKIIKEAKSNITEKEYLSSIAFFTDNQLMSLDNCKRLNNEYFIDFVLDCSFSTPDEKAEKYSQITPSDLAKTANEIFVSKNISFIIETSLNEDDVRAFVERKIPEL